MDEKTTERYVRWQDYRIQQLTFVINLFLTFATASLGLAINLRLEKLHHDSYTLNAVIILWALSALAGSVATVSRFIDFRHTAKKIKEQCRFDEYIAQAAGKVTYWTFAFQLFLYAIGAFIFIDWTLHSNVTQYAH